MGTVFEISASNDGAGGIGAFVAVFLLIGLAAFVWWLLRLIEAARVPESGWREADQNKVVAILLMLLLGLLGTIVYSFAMRPSLKRAGALGRS